MNRKNGSPSISKAKLPREDLSVVFLDEVWIEQRAGYEDRADRPYKATLIIDGETRNADMSFKVARALKFTHGVLMQYPLGTTSFLILNRTSSPGGNRDAYKSMQDFKRKLKECLTDVQRKNFPNFDEKVTCTTIHRSKGAEADVVVVLNVSEGQIPTIHSSSLLYRIFGSTEQTSFEEEERLFYVALTRAIRKLYLLTERGLESEFLKRIQVTNLITRESVLKSHPAASR
jgi:superfamily I DNA/RNA helicase